jgi:hypothetical protein
MGLARRPALEVKPKLGHAYTHLVHYATWRHQRPSHANEPVKKGGLTSRELAQVKYVQALEACKRNRKRMDEESQGCLADPGRLRLERRARREEARKAALLSRQMNLALQIGAVAVRTSLQCIHQGDKAGFMNALGIKNDDLASSPRQSPSRRSPKAMDAETPQHEKPKKRLSKKEKEEEAVRYIERYRKRMLEEANREMEMRKSKRIEEETPRHYKISFNNKKEVLEFPKEFKIDRSSRKGTQTPERRPYEIKSALRGSQEVHTGETNVHHNVILKGKETMTKNMLELVSEEDSQAKYWGSQQK